MRQGSGCRERHRGGKSRRHLDIDYNSSFASSARFERAEVVL